MSSYCRKWSQYDTDAAAICYIFSRIMIPKIIIVKTAKNVKILNF